MAQIPKPNKVSIKLHQAWVDHVSSYTGSSLGRITYGTKRIWKVIYTWTTINRAVAGVLYPALYTLGTGESNIPLYFHTRKGIRPVSGTVAESIEEGTVQGNQFTLKNTSPDFQLKPFDKLQVGPYCLEIINVTNSGLITVANMPDGLMSKVGREDIVRNYDFEMIGQNISGTIGYEMNALRGNENYNPEVVEFREIIV